MIDELRIDFFKKLIFENGTVEPQYIFEGNENRTTDMLLYYTKGIMLSNMRTFVKKECDYCVLGNDYVDIHFDNLIVRVNDDYEPMHALEQSDNLKEIFDIACEIKNNSNSDINGYLVSSACIEHGKRNNVPNDRFNISSKYRRYLQDLLRYRYADYDKCVKYHHLDSNVIDKIGYITQKPEYTQTLMNLVTKQPAKVNIKICLDKDMSEMVFQLGQNVNEYDICIYANTKEEFDIYTLRSRPYTSLFDSPFYYNKIDSCLNNKDVPIEKCDSENMSMSELMLICHKNKMKSMQDKKNSGVVLNINVVDPSGLLDKQYTDEFYDIAEYFTKIACIVCSKIDKNNK